MEKEHITKPMHKAPIIATIAVILVGLLEGANLFVTPIDTLWILSPLWGIAILQIILVYAVMVLMKSE